MSKHVWSELDCPCGWNWAPAPFLVDRHGIPWHYGDGEYVIPEDEQLEASGAGLGDRACSYHNSFAAWVKKARQGSIGGH